MTDFELCIINAVQSVFGDIARACFFHLQQRIYRRVQHEDLQQAHNDPNDKSVKVAAQMLCALAFVPVDDINDVFENLMEELPESFLHIAEYFEVNYIIFNITDNLTLII